MSQNIQLKDRVRVLPGLKKKDLPPMFDATFIATVPIKIPGALADTAINWQAGYGNYYSIVGQYGSGQGIVIDFDYYLWNAGTIAQTLQIINGSTNNEYKLYYDDEINPETGSHSGFIYYTIYDFNSFGTDTTPIVSAMLDIWESKIMINDATDYDQIK